MRDEPTLNSSLDVLDTVDTALGPIWCPVCSRRILDPIHQPHRTVVGVDIDDHRHPACIAHAKTGAIIPKAQRLGHDVIPKAAIQLSSTKVVPPHMASLAIHAPGSGRSFRRMIIDETPALYCSDECRLAAHQAYHSAVDIDNNLLRSTSPHPLPPTANSFSDVDGSRDDSGCLSDSPPESLSSASSPIIDRAINAYSRLSDIYGFAPLPPPPPFSPKVATSAQEAAPRLEGGVMMAARRIHAALCTKKPKVSFWGLPIHDDSEDDNKPIPGWTDGSNAWRASVYGFAPPRDFTRTDPDDAAIRAYGSYVATPHRSRGVHSTPGKNCRSLEIQPTSSSSLPTCAAGASTEELYRQYYASFARRARSRNSIHLRGADLSIPHTGSTRDSPREVPLLKPGAEGRLLVPDVKMRLVNSEFSGAGREHCTFSQRNSNAGYTANRTRSYQSESVTYPIMRLTPKKQKRVERRVINGVEHDVEVEVLIEEPVK